MGLNFPRTLQASQFDKNAIHTIFIHGKMLAIHFSCCSISTKKLHEWSMTSGFSYREIVRLAFSHKLKVLITFLVVFVTDYN